MTGRKTKLARGLCALLTVAALSPATASAGPGDLYVTDLNSFAGKGALVRVDPNTGAQAVISSGNAFQEPTGVAVTADGSLYVVDSDAFGGPCEVGCGGVLRVDPNTGAQTTVSAGNSFVNPTGIALAPNGDLIVADASAGPSSLGALIRVVPATGAQSIISQGQNFDAPFGVTVAADGAFLVADAASGGSTTGALIRVSPETGAQRVVSTGGTFVNPVAVTMQGSSVLLVDDQALASGAVYRDVNGPSQPVLSSGDKFASPHGIAVTPSGQIYVADRGGGSGPASIFRIDSGSGQQTTISTGNTFVDPFGIAVDPRSSTTTTPPTPPTMTTPTMTTPPPTMTTPTMTTPPPTMTTPPPRTPAVPSFTAGKFKGFFTRPYKITLLRIDRLLGGSRVTFECLKGCRIRGGPTTSKVDARKTSVTLNLRRRPVSIKRSGTFRLSVTHSGRLGRYRAYRFVPGKKRIDPVRESAGCLRQGAVRYSHRLRVSCPG